MLVILPVGWLVACSLLFLPEAALAAARQLEGRLSKKEITGAVENELGRSVLGIRFNVRPLAPYYARVPVLECVINRVVKNGPADFAGIKKGDVIKAVDGVSTRHMPADEITKRIRGEPGTRVKLTITRKGVDLEFSVERGFIEKLPDPIFRSSIHKQDIDAQRIDRSREAALTVLMAGSKRREAAASKVPPEDLERAVRECDKARFAFDAHDLPGAEKYLRKALKIDPGFVEARYLLGLYLDCLGKFAEAETALSEVVAKRPDWIDAWQALGTSQQSAGKLAEAVKAYKKCVELTDDAGREAELRGWITDLEAQIARPELYTVKESTDAEVTMSQSEVLIAEAHRLYTSEDYKGAAAKLEAAVSLAPQSDDAWRRLGTCYAKAGQYPEAVSAYNSFFKLMPDSPDKALVLHNLAACQVLSEQFAEAIASYKACLQASPPADELAAIWHELGVCQSHLGNFADAIESLRTAVKMYKEGEVPLELEFYIGELQEELSHYAKLDPDAPTYFPEFKRYQFCRWGRPDLLKVHIENPANIAGYKEELTATTRQAFAQWVQAADGIVRVIFVDKPRGADIHVIWTDDVEKVKTPVRGGETKVSVTGHKIDKATIYCLTVRKKEKTPVSLEAAQKVVLHEVGHALGLGHSSSPKDAMFAQSTQSKLSDRDSATVQALYKAKLPADINPYGMPVIQIYH